MSLLRKWKNCVAHPCKGSMAEKTDFGWDKKTKIDGLVDKPEKTEKKIVRRIAPPPEEKMKRGRGLVVFLFLFSVIASYIFSLIKDSR